MAYIKIKQFQHNYWEEAN